MVKLNDTPTTPELSLNELVQLVRKEWSNETHHIGYAEASRAVYRAVKPILHETLDLVQDKCQFNPECQGCKNNSSVIGSELEELKS